MTRYSIFLGFLLLMQGTSLRAGEISVEEIVRNSYFQPAVNYEGSKTVVSMSGSGLHAVEMDIIHAGNGKCRYIFNAPAGMLGCVIVDDGDSEWQYDSLENTAVRRKSALRSENRNKVIFETLENNYRFEYKGGADVCGRRCDIVDVVSKTDDGNYRRMWVDNKNGLILKNKYYTGGLLVMYSHFNEIEYPGKLDDGNFMPPGNETTTIVERPAEEYYDMGELCSKLKTRVYLPAEVSGGYVFESGSRLHDKNGGVVHIKYTDGMNVISLFESGRKHGMNSLGRRRLRDDGEDNLYKADVFNVIIGGKKLLHSRTGKFSYLIIGSDEKAMKSMAENLEDGSNRVYW